MFFHFYFKMTLKYNVLFSKMSLLASDMHSSYVLFLIWGEKKKKKKYFYIQATSIFKQHSPADLDKLRNRINVVCPFQTQNLTYMHVCTYLSIHFNLWELNPRLFTRASCFNGLITYPNPHLNNLGEAAKGFGWTSYKAPWQMVTIILLSISVIWRSG